MMKENRIYLTIILFCFMFLNTRVLAQENDITQNIGESLEIDKYLGAFESYIEENSNEDFNINVLYSDLITGKGIDYTNIFDVFFSNLIGEVKDSAKNIIILFIIIVIMALLSNLQLDKDSDVVKISKLIVIISIGSILLKNYIEIVGMFKNIVSILSNSMQIVSTFLTGVLIASGKITSTGVIEPLLLFISSGICVGSEYVVIPFFTISIAINIVSKISDNLKLDKISNIFRKSSLYIFSSAIAIFILILSMESSVTKSIDNVFFKTTQNIVSDVVPVVGNFLSDSLDTVMGATELIANVGGVVALISVLLIVSVPVTKILLICIMYKLLSAFSEPINEDSTISEFIDSFANVYKDMLGILIGIVVLFVMTTGIIMSIVSLVSG